MGLLDKLTEKVGKVVENVTTKSLSGESKELYEKDKASGIESRRERESQLQEKQVEVEKHKVKTDKSSLKELEPLLLKIEALDDNKIWIGGLDNFRTNQNAKFANILSGNKNVKTISICEEQCYICKFDGESFGAFKGFGKADVVLFEAEGLVSKKIKLKLIDGYSVSLDITENKEKVNSLKEFLK